MAAMVCMLGSCDQVAMIEVVPMPLMVSGSNAKMSSRHLYTHI